MALPVKFSPTIELGHVLQALVMLGAISGWALAATANVEARFQRGEAEVALIKQRLDQDEKAASQDRDEQRGRDAKTSASLDKIMDSLSDLRTLVAANGAHR